MLRYARQPYNMLNTHSAKPHMGARVMGHMICPAHGLHARSMQFRTCVLMSCVRRRGGPPAMQVHVWLESPRRMLLHWSTNDWQLPDASLWPPGSNEAGGGAVQTPFGGDGKLTLTFPKVRRRRRCSAAQDMRGLPRPAPQSRHPTHQGK